MEGQAKILIFALWLALVTGIVSILLMIVYFIMPQFSSLIVFRQCGTWSLLASVSSIAFWVLGSGVGGLTKMLASLQEDMEFIFPFKLWATTCYYCRKLRICRRFLLNF